MELFFLKNQILKPGTLFGAEPNQIQRMGNAGVAVSAAQFKVHPSLRRQGVRLVPSG
jgi:hypothetical protein